MVGDSSTLISVHKGNSTSWQPSSTLPPSCAATYRCSWFYSQLKAHEVATEETTETSLFMKNTENGNSLSKQRQRLSLDSTILEIKTSANPISSQYNFLKSSISEIL